MSQLLQLVVGLLYLVTLNKIVLFPHAVPTFRITPPNVTVFENDPEGVEVCVVTNDSLARDIVVTVQTASKVDSFNQATGKIRHVYSIDTPCRGPAICIYNLFTSFLGKIAKPYWSIILIYNMP